MQPNNNQFPNNPNFTHSNLPSLTHPTTQHSTIPNAPHPSHAHPHSHPHSHQHPSPQQQPHQTQFTFNNNPPHTPQIPLSLPTISRSQSFGGTPAANNISHTAHTAHTSHTPSTGHTNPVYSSSIPSNTQYLYQQPPLQQRPPLPHANNGNNSNNSTAAVPYTISNIQDKGLLSLQTANHLNANRKRTRAGFEVNCSLSTNMYSKLRCEATLEITVCIFVLLLLYN